MEEFLHNILLLPLLLSLQVEVNLKLLYHCKSAESYK